MTIERRKFLRRQADRDLLAKLEELQQQGSGGMSREQRHLRRRAIRHNCQATLALRVATSYGHSDTWMPSDYPIPGKLIDLSVDGCSVFSPHKLDTGDRLALAINMPKGSRIQCEGIVRWTKAVAERNGYANGVQFTEMPGESRARLEAFLKKLEADLGL